MMIKIISGGQTGVDRAALDAAMVMGVVAGGWVPEGRQAEDGVIEARYPIVELPGAGYRERTRQNVIDSDATVIIYFDELSGGTQATLRDCLRHKKLCCLIDGLEITTERAAQKITAFISRHKVKTLNVAGPRASRDARAYDYAYETMKALITHWRSLT